MNILDQILNTGGAQVRPLVFAGVIV